MTCRARRGRCRANPMGLRSLEELLRVDDPAWPLVMGWIADAKNPVEVLTPDPVRRGQALVQTQVTIGSPMDPAVYSPLLTDGPPIGRRSPRPVPVTDLFGVNIVDLPKQLGIASAFT